jgi:hypothetical protein
MCVQLALDQLGGFPRQGGALEEHPADLLSQGANAPALKAAQLGVEVAGEGFFDQQQLGEVAPAHLSRQCRDNLRVRPRHCHCELHHPAEVSAAEPRP